MGVPAFFRWLSKKYPSVVIQCVEEKPKKIDGVEIPVDSLKPNPNGVEYDNLYLDMNGIIHPCTHPENKPAPKNEDEMMIAIFECIDRLFSIVRPRKLLYMAIDGVAPRAKMNQQRSRRFRASKETLEKVDEVARLREELLSKGAYLPPEKPKETHFDSNCITPGTPFMSRLSTCLEYYIHSRLNNNPAWKGIKVILSDASVPGEGEHKIMDFIRRQRGQPDHDPNTKHVLCGADADLIMLGLATHEPNFIIIREEFQPNKPKPCDLCNYIGHEMKDCVGCPKPADGEIDVPTFGEEVPFIFVRLNVLREYLERELYMPGLPFKYDFERALDDWVFMCFFVGNDFLPHLPSLEIREGAIDRLINLYKNCVYKTGGFLTDSGDVDLNRVQVILNELGKVEDQIFKKRRQTEMWHRQKDSTRKKMATQNKDDKPAWIMGGQWAPTPLGPGSETSAIANPRHAAFQGRIQGLQSKPALESLLRPQGVKNDSQQTGKKRSLDEANVEEEDEDVNDEVRLWEDGFKDRYYESKFDAGHQDINFRITVAHEYIKGLCWVLRYYYQGCASWNWFFPFHYAPFASDFIDVGSLTIKFEKGTKPFKPLEQLMGVFPAASSSHIPKPWAELMHNPFSPIIDFYPTDFKIDLNGKKFAWQGVALLPFVDENRLFKALESYYSKLTPAEKMRNIRGDDKLFVGIENKGHSFLKGLYNSPAPANDEEEFELCIDGMRGTVLLCKDNIYMSTIVSPIRDLPAIDENIVVSARYRDLKYSADYIFKAKRLKGAIEPPRVLKPGSDGGQYSQSFAGNGRSYFSGSGGSKIWHGMQDQYRHQYNRSNSQSMGFSQPRERGIYGEVPPPLIQQYNTGRNYSRQSYGYSTAGNNQHNYQQGFNRNYNDRFNFSERRDSRHFSNRGSNYGNQDNRRHGQYNQMGGNNYGVKNSNNRYRGGN